MNQDINYMCAECGIDVTVERGREIENDNGDLICKDCDNKLTWEKQNFPIWIEYEFYNDDWGMLRAIARQTDVPQSDIPKGDGQKYTCPLLWYKVDEGGNVEGPYAEKGDDKKI